MIYPFQKNINTNKYREKKIFINSHDNYISKFYLNKYFLITIWKYKVLSKEILTMIDEKVYS